MVDRVVLDGSPGGLVQEVVGSGLVDIGSGDVPMGILVFVAGTESRTHDRFLRIS